MQDHNVPPPWRPSTADQAALDAPWEQAGHASAPPAGPAHGLPRPFGPFTLLGHLARGGMADVYAATLSSDLGRRSPLAIKRMRPRFAEEPECVRMFLEEARLGAQLSHPNLCDVYELGQVEGEPYIAMEYLHGVPLSRLLSTLYAQRQQLPPAVVVGIIAQACQGLSHAHRRRDPQGKPAGIIHRDISPQNLFVRDDGLVKLLDFGIAKAADSAHRTKTGQLKGKESYVSPEQLLGHPVDVRSDIWSLGVVLHETLTGAPLFPRRSLLETAQAITRDPIPSVLERRPDLPRALARVVSCALRRRPQARYASADAMRRALITALDGEKVASMDTIGEVVRSLCAETLTAHRRLFAGALDPTGPPTVSPEDAPCEPATTTYQLGERRPDSEAPTTLAAALSAPDVGDEAPTRALPSQRPSPPRSSPPHDHAPSAGEVPAPLLGSRVRLSMHAPSLAAYGASAVAALLIVLMLRAMDPERAARPAPDRVVSWRGPAAPLQAPTDTSAHRRSALHRPAPGPLEPAHAQLPQSPEQAPGTAVAQDTPENGEAAADRARRRAERRRRRAQEQASAPSDGDAPAAERSPPAPPETDTPGTLHLDAHPYAAVSLDGRELGVTPLLGVRVSSGTHQLRLVAPDGRVKTVRLRVRPGQTLRRRFVW